MTPTDQGRTVTAGVCPCLSRVSGCLFGAPRTQPVEQQCDDEVGHLSRGDIVVGAEPPVRQLPDHRGQCVSHHPSGRSPGAPRSGRRTHRNHGPAAWRWPYRFRRTRTSPVRRRETARRRYRIARPARPARPRREPAGHTPGRPSTRGTSRPWSRSTKDRAVGETGLLSDVRDGGGVKTLAREHFLGSRHNLVAPLRLVLGTDGAASPSAGHLSTNPSSCPMVSMNSSTMSSTTERAGRTRSREPTTCPTK
jgi:hypothetical protein